MPPLRRSASPGGRGRSRSSSGEIETASYGNIHGLPAADLRLTGECDFGCNYGSKNTMGHAGRGWSTHCEVRYTDVRVPFENVLGEPGDGFRIWRNGSGRAGSIT